MDKEVKLFGFWASAYVLRVEIALNFKGIEYEYIEEDMKNKSDLLLKYNPVYKKVPVLVHGGKAIAESMLIVEYIDEAWPDKPILPRDPYDRATQRFWAQFAEEKCLPSGFKYFSTKGEQHEEARIELIANLKILEGTLEGKKFFGGESIGLVDIIAGWMPFWIRRMEEVVGDKVVEIENLPHLHAWFGDFLDLPFVSQKLPPQDKICEYLRARRCKELGEYYA